MIDLHTHSTFSDGSCSPTELVQLAKNIGLSAIALTDHNTISGLEEFEKAGIKVYVIGDAAGGGFALNAVRDGFMCAAKILGIAGA